MSSRREARGYTIVELMAALAIFAVGVTGVIALQKVVITSNSNARHVAVAAQIANAWVGQLEADASLWDEENGWTNTTWLNVAGSSPDVWVQPTWNATRAFGPAFGPLGQPIQDVTQAPFCVHLRLSPLYPAAPTNGIVRAEVKVFWRRTLSGADGAPPCAAAIGPANATNPLDFHFVMQSTALRQMP